MSSLPIAVPDGHLATIAAERDSVPTDPLAHGLLDALSPVPDPRKRRGRRYGFTAVLATAVCAVLAGARSYAAISEWAADTSQAQREALGLNERAPDLVTIWRILTAVDPLLLDRAVGHWLARLLDLRAGRKKGRRGRRRVLAVDGKSVRGARNHTDPEDRAPHLMGCLDHESGVVLAQVAVDGKTNEIPMFSVLLDQIEDLDGVLITADALHAQREHASYLHGRGAHYLITVKGNQPKLRHQLRSLPWKDVPIGDTQTARAHGRIEKRTLKVVTIAAGILFPHATQAIQVVRRTRRRGTKKTWQSETVYAITSLPVEHAQPTELAAWIRMHWSIENRLHWVRDVTYAEDASQARTGTGPHIMASLRNLAISVLRLNGHTNIAAGLRYAARKHHRPLEMINNAVPTTLQ
jgi:predicted transposase YbfD/YdcC